MMKELGYDATFIKAEGHQHDFRMWNKYLEITLDELLPLKRRPIYPESE